MDDVVDTLRVNFYFDIYVTLILCFVLSSLGMLTNIVNIVIYCKSGVKDSVTVTFVALSLWEMCYSLLNLLSSICDIIERYFPVANVNFLTVEVLYCLYPLGLFHILANIVTVYLSTERCTCVLIPLKVKGLFTKSRSFYINIVFIILCTACICPMWTTQGLQWGFDPTVNSTRWVLWLAENRMEILSFSLYFYTVIMPPLTQIIITIESALMINVVRVQHKFRQTSASSVSVSVNNSGKSRKESKMTKIVICKDIIFLMSYFPWFIRCMEDIAPDSDVVKANKDLIKIFSRVGRMFTLINVNSNFILYYTLSTKYKHVFLSTLCKFRK